MQKSLKQFKHKAGKLQHAPHKSTPIQYGAKKQYTTQELETPLFNNNKPIGPMARILVQHRLLYHL